MTLNPGSTCVSARMRQRSTDWPVFQANLGEAIDLIGEDQFLIIQLKEGDRFIQFAGQGSFGIRVEVVSNHFLKGADRLSAEEHDALIRLGWNAPSGDPGMATPELDPDGSPNYFVDFPKGTSVVRLADLAVSTLADALSIPHPGNLQYEAFDTEGNVIYLPVLGLKLGTESVTSLPLPEQLLHAVRSATGIGDLDYDSEGDLTLQFGELAIFIAVGGEPPWVRLCAPLVENAEEGIVLLARLNALNAEMTHMHFVFNDGIVYALSSISASALMGADFSGYLNQFSAKAEEVMVELRATAAGCTYLSGDASSHVLQ